MGSFAAAAARLEAERLLLPPRAAKNALGASPLKPESRAEEGRLIVPANDVRGSAAGLSPRPSVLLNNVSTVSACGFLRGVAIT